MDTNSWITGNSDVKRLGKGCRPSIKERRKAAVLSGIEMFRQLLGNECALLSFFQCECQQNSPDDAEQDNIRKIPMNAVLPCFHSLDGHYRSMGQALARGEGNGSSSRLGESRTGRLARRSRN